MALRATVNPLQQRLSKAWRERAVMLKAVSFAMVGVVNTLVNYTVFWVLLLILGQSPLADWSDALSSKLRETSTLLEWVTPQDARAVIATTIAWVIAVSGSYVMNSLITFAHESGRTLSWRSYLLFATSGLLGLLTDTTTLLVSMRYFPIMFAKLLAILASFVVNFSLSHFVVFRARGPQASGE